MENANHCSLWDRLDRESAEQTVLRHQIQANQTRVLACQITTEVCLCSLWDRLDNESAKQTALSIDGAKQITPNTITCGSLWNRLNGESAEQTV